MTTGKEWGLSRNISNCVKRHRPRAGSRLSHHT